MLYFILNEVEKSLKTAYFLKMFLFIVYRFLFLFKFLSKFNDENIFNQIKFREAFFFFYKFNLKKILTNFYG